jgi:hypothetical protein
MAVEIYRMTHVAVYEARLAAAMDTGHRHEGSAGDVDYLHPAVPQAHERAGISRT